MPHIVSTATALPPHQCNQADTRDAMAGVCQGDDAMLRLIPVFDRTGVETRYFVEPLDWYADGQSFEVRNRVFAESGLQLACQAATRCLEAADVDPGDVDAIFCVTTTGLMTPSLDARLASALGLRADVRRFPLFGLGCAGGAGALIRATDALRAYPDQRSLVVSLELCSLVFSPIARTATDLIGTALFGDGAAAVLLSGDEANETSERCVAVRQCRSHLFREAPDLMGWDFTADGMRLVLSREVPAFVAAGVKPVVAQFLDDQDIALSDIGHFLLHPGGARVMATYRSAFDLPDAALEYSRETMRRYGNQSSASVLFMLHDLMASGRPARDDLGLIVALGPGFAAEMLTVKWS